MDIKKEKGKKKKIKKKKLGGVLPPLFCDDQLSYASLLHPS